MEKRNDRKHRDDTKANVSFNGLQRSVVGTARCLLMGCCDVAVVKSVKVGLAEAALRRQATWRMAALFAALRPF